MKKTYNYKNQLKQNKKKFMKQVMINNLLEDIQFNRIKNYKINQINKNKIKNPQ